jgi:D-inositol-3-phosphate glycosyltransferase
VRILLACHYFEPHVGGIENVVASEARELAAAGHEVTVLTSAVGARPGSSMHPDGFCVVRVAAWNLAEDRFGAPFPLCAPSLWLRALRLVRAADVVHVHEVLYLPSWAAALACALARKPYLLTQHVQVVAHDRSLVRTAQMLVYRTIGRAIFRGASRVAVLNDGVVDFVLAQGVAADRVFILPNGVDVERFRPPSGDERAAVRERFGLPPGRVLAVFVGRFVPKKGFDRALAATSDDYTIVFVGGDPPPEAAGDARAIFLGQLSRDDLAEVYRACDLFLLPSESEGFPLTAQEAMASSLPIVITDDPGYAPYALDRAHVGWLDGSARQLSSLMHELAADPGRRAAMARYALEYARTRFLWRDHARTLLREYSQL